MRQGQAPGCAGNRENRTERHEYSCGRRLLFVHLSTLGVRSPFLQNLASECSRRGLPFRIITISPDADDHVDVLATDAEHWRLRVPECRRLGRRGARVVKLVVFFARLVRIARRWRPAVIGNWGGGFAMAVLLRKLFVRRAGLVYRAHEFIRPDDIESDNPIYYLRPVLRFERRQARAADLVIIPDPIRAQHQAPYLRIDNPLIIRNAPLREAAELEDSPLAQTVRAIRDEVPNAVLLVSAGTISAGTKAVEMIQSAADWPEEVVCLLIGKVSDDLCRRIKSLESISCHFRLLGFHPYPQSTGSSRSRRGHCLLRTGVVGTQKYCAPAKLYEYFEAGLAVLTSNQESLASIVDGHALGETADADSPDSICDAVRRLAADRDRLAAMGARARTLFENDWHF